MALKADPADQALLLELQELDTRRQQLRHRAGKLPEIATLADLRARRDALQRTLTEQQGAWEDAKAELGRVEADVAVVEARVARDRARLQGSASVKDIQGLEQELAALGKRQGDLEDIQLAVMETVEERGEALQATRDTAETLDAAIVEATAARDAAAAAVEHDLRAVEADRATIAGRVPSELLALYDRQRERYGVGASHLRAGVSSASGVALNSSDMNVIRSAAPDDVLLCPDSSAVLVRTAESGL